MSAGTILLLVLFFAVIFGLPHWGYARPYAARVGYWPSGLFGVLLVVVLILLLTGHLNL